MSILRRRIDRRKNRANGSGYSTANICLLMLIRIEKQIAAYKRRGTTVGTVSRESSARSLFRLVCLRDSLLHVPLLVRVQIRLVGPDASACSPRHHHHHHPGADALSSIPARSRRRGSDLIDALVRFLVRDEAAGES